MLLSQNAWPAGERAEVDLTTITVPGTTTSIPVKAGDVATVLLWVATRWHTEVEPLVEPGNWGYAYRPIRGTTAGLSNHASGTAIDLNAPKHPLGTEPSATMTKAQVAAAKRIEADSGGVVRWGGSYTGRKDCMHWEINAAPAAVSAFAAQLRDSSTTPAPPPSEEDDMPKYIAYVNAKQYGGDGTTYMGAPGQWVPVHGDGVLGWYRSMGVCGAPIEVNPEQFQHIGEIFRYGDTKHGI